MASLVTVPQALMATVMVRQATVGRQMVGHAVAQR
jgi:hypothetical protein